MEYKQCVKIVVDRIVPEPIFPLNSGINKTKSKRRIEHTIIKTTAQRGKGETIGRFLLLKMLPCVSRILYYIWPFVCMPLLWYR